MDVLEGVLPAEATTLDNFDEVVRIYQSRVYRLLLMHTGNPDAAEELTQECFVRAYRTRNRYRGESSLFTWLARIAINLAHDRARSPRFRFWNRLVQLENEPGRSSQIVAAPHTSPEVRLIQQQQVWSVLERLQRLSPQQREVFVLRFLEDLSLEEVARCTNRKLSTVKTHLRRGLDKLKEDEERERSHA